MTWSHDNVSEWRGMSMSGLCQFASTIKISGWRVGLIQN